MNQEDFKGKIGTTVEVRYLEPEPCLCGECGQPQDDERLEVLFCCPVCGSESVMSDLWSIPSPGERDHCDRCGYEFEIVEGDCEDRSGDIVFEAKVTRIREIICPCGNRQFAVKISVGGYRIHVINGMANHISKTDDRGIVEQMRDGLPEKAVCTKCGAEHDNPALLNPDSPLRAISPSV